MTTLVMLCLLFSGAYSYYKLPVNAYPNVETPSVSVFTSYPGTSVETMEKLITTPLEKRLKIIEGLKKISSSTTLGMSQISLQFDLDKDMNLASQEIQKSIDQAPLPKGLPERPQYRKNSSGPAIIYYFLTSPSMTVEELYYYGENFFSQRVSSIKGVASAEVFGANKSIRIQVDPEKLTSKQLSLEHVRQAVVTANPYLPIGQILGETSQQSLKAVGQLQSIEEFKKINLKKEKNNFLRLEDIATISGETENDDKCFFVTKKQALPSLIIGVAKQPGANTVEVIDLIKQQLPKIKAELPNSIEIHSYLDESKFVKQSLFEVQETLILAIILVVLVIFSYIGSIKQTIIPSIAIPFSIIFTFFVIYNLGFSLNMLSLLALTLAIGFVVDDAIVVMENIIRHKEKGLSAKEASLIGTKQISFTVISMTLSLIAVFIPLIFFKGKIGILFKEFSITLAVAVLTSGFISLTLTPMLCSLPFFQTSSKKESRILRFSNRLNAFLLKLYQPILDKALLFKKVTFAIGIVSLIFTVLLFRQIPISFIPNEEMGYLHGWVQAQEGSNKKQASLYLREMGDLIIEHPAVESLLSMIQTDTGGFVLAKLKPASERTSADAVSLEISKKSKSLPGAQLFISSIPLINLSVGNNARGGYEYLLKSYSTKDLYTTSKLLKSELEKTDLFTWVNAPSITHEELEVKILREKAELYGVNIEQIEHTLGNSFSPQQITKMQVEGKEFPVYLELKKKFRKGLDAFDHLHVLSSATQKMVPIKELVQISKVLGPKSINHLDLIPSASISFQLKEGVNFEEALEEIDSIAKKVLPENVTGSIEGSGKIINEYIQQIWILLLIAVVVMYIVLGILYESFIHPLTILSSLLFALLGGALTLWVLGEPLTLYGFIGFILLIGIVKKNGIMIVDHANELLSNQDTTPEKAVYEACLVRFRPIMMTTAAAVLGAVPIALSIGSTSDARSSLGLVIIGGLVFSQLFTLVFTPILYLFFEKKLSARKISQKEK